MRRILWGALLVVVCVLNTQAQDQMISRWIFTGNTAMPDSVHRSVRRSPMRLSAVMPTDCPSCPYVPGNPPQLPGFGTYGWPTSATPDTSRYIEIPVVIQPGWSLDMARLSFEAHRESQAPTKWQIRYSKNKYGSPMASGVMGNPNTWSTITIPLGSLLPLQDLTDSVIFRIYPYEAKKGPSEQNNTIWRLDSVRIYSAGSPLPVELVNFSALPDGEDIRLQWATATEINSESFGIEHALDGQPFGELDRVPAAGWSVALQSYQWMHRAAGPGQHYYRLRMVDRDGHEEYSPVVTCRIDTEERPEAIAWIAHGQVFVQGITNPSGGSLQLHDVQGRKIASLQVPAGDHQPRLDVEGLLRSGIYLLTWYPAGQASHSLRLVYP